MIQIAPSLLSCNFATMGEDVRAVDAAGADAHHLDVMDGVFVPNISFGLPVVKAIRPYSDLPFDVHLMIVNPEKYVERFIDAGADWVTIHYEATDKVRETLKTIRSLGKKAGLSLKPKTPAEAIFPYLDDCDMVLVMSVEPGFGGQSFMPESLEKTRLIKAEIERRGGGIDIEIDGGINEKTAPLVKEAGAEILVAGSSVFGKPSMAEAIRVLREG